MVDVGGVDVGHPKVPPGRFVDTERGELFVREAGTPGAPPVVLLHGWVGTGGTNWLLAFPKLAPHFRVIAPDLRGHGRGIRSSGRFRLADCAADVGALIDALGVGPVVLVGFSMGGPVAQLTWRAHREVVGALVFCSTSYRFVTSSVGRIAVTSLVPAFAQATRVVDLFGRVPLAGARALFPTVAADDQSLAAWGSSEMRRHDMRHVLEAGVAIGTYDAGSWISDIDVPTAVVLTAKDRAVEPLAQLRLASRIKGATVYAIAEGHLGATSARARGRGRSRVPRRGAASRPARALSAPARQPPTAEESTSNSLASCWATRLGLSTRFGQLSTPTSKRSQ